MLFGGGYAYLLCKSCQLTFQLIITKQHWSNYHDRYNSLKILSFKILPPIGCFGQAACDKLLATESLSETAT